MRINPPTLFWILIAAIVATHRYFPLIAFDESWLPWIGAVVFVLGIGVSAAGKRQFQRAGTNVYTFEDPGEFVTDGLYGVSRNPMYLGLVLAGGGAALISGTLRRAAEFSAAPAAQSSGSLCPLPCELSETSREGLPPAPQRAPRPPAAQQPPSGARLPPARPGPGPYDTRRLPPRLGSRQPGVRSPRLTLFPCIVFFPFPLPFGGWIGGWGPSGMPKVRITAKFVETVRRPGKYVDRYGLILRVESTGRRYWEQRVTVGGRRRTLGIGAYPVVSLAMARDAALENLRIVRAGGDPFASRRRAKAPTFAEAAHRVLELHRSKWSHPRQATIWITSLEQYAFPRLGGVPVSALTTSDLMDVLTPIWFVIPETAQRIRQRIGVIMKWSVAHGYRTDDPAGPVLTDALPSNHASKEHYRALQYRDVSGALAAVRATAAFSSTKRVFEFAVLTAARSSEARGALWTEIDFDAAMWLVPPERMKARPCSPRRYSPDAYNTEVFL